MTTKSILMVCRGNICRSPMAEGFFLHQLNQCNSSILISSAGLTALVNEAADAHAQSVMLDHNIDILTHRARQLTDLMARSATLILVMSRSQLRLVSELFPSVRGKTFLIGHWQNFEISDPYKKSREQFEHVYQQIELAWQAWKSRILSC